MRESAQPLVDSGLDTTDWAILREFQIEARLSFKELSRRVHLSAPAVGERVRRLESCGVLSGYHAHIDAARAGRAIAAMIRMTCYGPRCLLKVATTSMPALEGLLDRIASYGQPCSTMILDSPAPWSPLR